MNRALIIVDMQVDFVTGSLGTKEAERIVPAILEYTRLTPVLSF
jgi:nicotinamidase/pyrazinamidase